MAETGFVWADDAAPPPTPDDDTEWTPVTARQKKFHQRSKPSPAETPITRTPNTRTPQSVSRPPVERVLARKKTWVTEPCTEGHEECLASSTKTCVYKIRKTILCKTELNAPGSCVYGDGCMFSHMPV